MIVVTTPTGHVGHRLLELLLAADEPVRVIARDPARLPGTARERVDVIAGSHADPAVLDRALDGADALLWVVPPDPRADSPQAHYVGYAQRAREALHRADAEVRVVAISTMGDGADAGQLSAARAMDEVIASAGAPYRALAAPFFMENLLSQAASILDEGRLALASAPDRILPLVATDDLAAHAAGLLADRAWAGTARVPVSSPDALTPPEIADVLGETVGREVVYEQLSLDDYGSLLRGFGMSPGWAAGMTAMAAAQNAGFYDADLEAARGAGPTTLRAWSARSLAAATAGR